MSYRQPHWESRISRPLRCFHKRYFELQSTSRVTLSGAAKRDLGHHRRTKLLEAIIKDNVESKGPIGGEGEEGGERFRRVKIQEDENLHEQRMRRIKEQKAADEDLRQALEKRRLEKEKEMQEKRKDLEMLKTYHPWGGGGGGAPRVTRSGTLLAQRRRFLAPTQLKTSDDFYSSFGKPGGGAPRRSDSGNVDASVVADPDTRFQKQLKKEIDQSLRYKPSQNMEPPQQLKRERSELEKEMLQKEQEEKARYARRLEQQIIEDKPSGFVKPTFEPYFPWGNSYPKRNNSGKLLVEKRREEEKDVGAWLNGLGEKRVRMRERRNKEPNIDTYSPWGKSGGGAPLKADDGKLLVDVFGNFENKKKEVIERSTNSCNHQLSLTSSLSPPLPPPPPSLYPPPLEVIKENNEALSTATWVESGQVGQPIRDPISRTIIGGQTKQTSDITSKQFDIRRPLPVPKPAPYHRQQTLTVSQLLKQEADLKIPYHLPPAKISTTRNGSRPKDSIQRLTYISS
ncbi:PREDICTED: uncharacterized protein LOC100636248 isoform X2 [Amphimedon queenslandica]|uniref:Uncharacterized protein n=1 Tax=Amphimedon queenslandica TaxID=400682 RepID=A0AAN0JDZ7_AMPQE|nr:PREDICTED: uncharacterized protein LOC100636248 isoform X2 [Amphimedon queenslandica]|eukprot:XP_019854986.1 PREDICTED: uncharacterized protein LOC100636248 isoform X2 [Amphimedon queenslandica]